jgi:hypothetical protein
MMTLSFSSKKPNFLLAKIAIRSSVSMERIANLIATRLMPGGDVLKWETLDGEEIRVLGLKGILGGDLELQNVALNDYTLTYLTDIRFLEDEAERLGVQLNDEDFVDVTPLFFWTLGKIPGLIIEPVELGK